MPAKTPALCEIRRRHFHEFNGRHADVSHLQGNTENPETWCRMHHTMDHCPEHCALCHGYYHSGPCANPTSTARDGGGSMLSPRWPR